jgi:glycosyltransferase involved in cell wall biosynthesis
MSQKIEPRALKNGHQPLVSVGIPTYNRPEGLHKALTRVTGQTYRNLEILVSDNQSKDQAAVDSVMQRFQNDGRIQFFRQPENIGAIRNLHFLLKTATGEYFLWVADDDEVEKEYIFTLVNALLSHPKAAVAMTGYDVTDLMAEPHIKVNLTEHLHGLRGPTAFERLSRYIRQPDHLGKSRILWGMFPRQLMVKAFDDCMQAVKAANGAAPQPNLAWPEMPIEMRMLGYGDLVIDDGPVLFHVFLLPTSDGQKALSGAFKKMMTLPGRTFTACRHVVMDTDLDPKEKTRLIRHLRHKCWTSKIQLFMYYGIIAKSPRLARWIKKVWYLLS